MKKLPSVQSLRLIPKIRRNSSVVPRRDVNESENTKALSVGVDQYNRIVPKSVDEKLNHKKIEVFVPGGESNDRDQNTCVDLLDITKAKARIYLRDNNHMHQTPVQPDGYQWVVQYERFGVYRTPWMGWTVSDHAFSRYENEFPTLEDAIEYCKFQGCGYHVSYPRWRYTPKQTYADNFKWKGFHKEDPDS